MVSSVKYKDDEMDTIIYDNRPKNIGLAPVNEKEEKVLSNPSNHTVYKEIKEKEVELEAEACFAKGRWSKIKQNN